MLKVQFKYFIDILNNQYLFVVYIILKAPFVLATMAVGRTSTKEQSQSIYAVIDFITGFPP